MIRIRRVKSAIPLVRMYELEIRRQGGDPNKIEQLVVRRGLAVRRLEGMLGIGDAWSFIHEADRQWGTGNRAWAVEFEETGR